MTKRELKLRVREILFVFVQAGVILLAMIALIIAVILIGIVGYAGLKAFAGMMGVC